MPAFDCPNCGQATVSVQASVWVKVDVDHEHDLAIGSGYDYDDASPAGCRNCNYRGRLMEFDPEGRDEACECATGLVPGTLYVPHEGTVERCDLCQQYRGDLEAAVAVSEKVGTTAWALMEHPNGRFEIERVTAELCETADGEVHWIAEGTDPWTGNWRDGFELATDDRTVWPTAAAEQAWSKSPFGRPESEQVIAEDFAAWLDRNGLSSP